MLQGLQQAFCHFCSHGIYSCEKGRLCTITQCKLVMCGVVVLRISKSSISSFVLAFKTGCGNDMLLRQFSPRMPSPISLPRSLSPPSLPLSLSLASFYTSWSESEMNTFEAHAPVREREREREQWSWRIYPAYFTFC